MQHQELIRAAKSSADAGRYAEAESHCRAALEAKPGDIHAMSLLGLIQSARGDHAAAVSTYRELTQRQPRVALHWANLGTALRSAGEFDSALSAYQHATGLGASAPHFLLNFALLHIDRLEYGRAKAMLSQAAEAAPLDAEIRYFHAVTCYEDVENEAAQAELARWRSFDGLTPDVLARIGTLLTQLGATAEAEAALREALRLDPAHAPSAVRLAQLLERTNRVAEAQAQLHALPAGRDAVGELADDLLSCEARLAERLNDWAGAEARYLRLLERTREPHQRYHVLFPLARVQDERGDYAGAFASAQAAHESQLAFLRKAAPRFLDPRAQTFGITRFSAEPGDLAQWHDPAAPPAERSPVFVVGFPRSGTTLLEQMLDAHPLLRAMDEQPFLQNAIDRMRGDGVQYPERLAALDAPVVREFYWQRVATQVQLGPGQRLVDKNPLNLLRLPAIRRLFPNARVILAIRHPADVLISNFMQHYRAPEIAVMCGSIGTLADGFVRAFDFWYRQRDLLAPAVLELKYEDFVADFEGHARRIADFLALPWDDAMLEPGQQARKRGYISTPSYAQVVQPVNRRAVGRWRNYERWLRPAAPILRPYLERWGYAVDAAGAVASTNSE